MKNRAFYYFKRIFRLISIPFVAMTLVSLSCTQIPENETGKEKVVLVHGFGRSTKAMWVFQEYLEDAGYQVYNVGYSSLIQDIKGIKNEFYTKIDNYLRTIDEETVHFVGHSMGGLLIRSYLGERNVKKLGNVVLLGSPNKGTHLVDLFNEKWYSFLGGPALDSLSAKGSSFLSSLKAPHYNLGVVAGVTERKKRSDLIPGKDDGIIPLESTPVEGMKDYIVLPISHYMMRYDQIVAKEAIHFLRKNKFSALKDLSPIWN